LRVPIGGFVVTGNTVTSTNQNLGVSVGPSTAVCTGGSKLLGAGFTIVQGGNHQPNGNHGLAEENYRSAINTDAKYEPALFNLAILRTAREDGPEAISPYKRAVAARRKTQPPG
jgi:hypothetical protein